MHFKIDVRSEMLFTKVDRVRRVTRILLTGGIHGSQLSLVSTCTPAPPLEIFSHLLLVARDDMYFGEFSYS